MQNEAAAPPATVEDPLLTPEEVSDALRVLPRTLARWAQKGWIPSIELPNGHRRYRRSAIDKILDGAEARNEADETSERPQRAATR